ncbi:MAG: competence/damage-inducible protein A [Bacteroidota bacterium]
MPKITIITIGDELLIGQVVDTNAAFMAQQLNAAGMEVYRTITIADTLDEIGSALENALTTSDIVLMTGGLGPTKDDVTKKALADYFGVNMVFSEPTWERIERFFQRLGRETTPAHREQCFMPANATLLTNKMGTAPGMWMEKTGKVVVSMPGVPYEMEHLMLNEVIPHLQQKFQLNAIHHRTLLTVGEGESRLAAKVEDLEDQLPPHIKLAYLPNLGGVRLRLTGRGKDSAAVKRDLQQYGDAFRERLSSFIYGEGDLSLAQHIGNLLVDKKMQMATAESCTGGFLAHKITANAGSSAYFQGSIIAYDNHIKQQLLGVSKDTLKQHGAVSEQTVAAMAQGALAAMGVDLAISTSGIAGPGGGSEEKPVGTIWVAVATKDAVKTMRLHGAKDRLKNIEYTANRALGLAWEVLRNE